MDNAVEYIKSSFELKNQGYYKQAIEMLYKALTIENDNIEILAQLAQLYQLLGNYERAVGYIEKVLDFDEKHLDCLFLQKEILIKQGALEHALDVADKIYRIDSSMKNLAAQISLLRLLKKYESIDEAVKSGLDFDDSVFYELGLTFFERGKNEKAIEFLQKGYEKNSLNKDVLLLLTKIYYDNGDFESSKKMFIELEKLDSNAEVNNYLGLFKLNEQNYQSACAFFLNSLRLDERNHEYAYNLASAYFLQGWCDEAAKYFKQAIALDSKNPKYHYSLAHLYYQSAKYDKALSELNYIATFEPEHEPSKILKALIDFRNGNPVAAKIQLEDFVKSNPTDDFAFAALSRIYRELSLIDTAKDTIEHALVLKPESLAYRGDLADIEFELKSYEKVLELSEKMSEINPKYLYSYILAAKASLELGDYEGLYDSAQSAINLDENCPEGYYYNALALFEQGDKTFAIESLKKSISLDLNNAALYVKMSEFYQEIGDLQNAYAWAKEASEIDYKSYRYKWLCAKLASAMHKEQDALKYYSQGYRIAPFDEDLVIDYTNYLSSLGKEKQAKTILTALKKNNLNNKNLSLK